MKSFNKYILLIGAFLLFSSSLFSQAIAGEDICDAPLQNTGLSCISYVNDNATRSANPGATADPACWKSAPDNDVWVSFVATSPDMTVSTDVSLYLATFNDTQIAVYKTADNSCSGATTLIGCDEDGGINVDLNGATGNPPSLLSLLELVGLVPGDTYFVRIDGNQTGSFCLSMYDTYTPGSKPCEAQIIHPNNVACDPLNGNKVINATSSNTSTVKTVLPGTYLPLGQDYCGADDETAQYGTWTTFTGNSTSNGNITVTNYAPTAVDYTLFSGNCVALTCIGSQQAATAGAAGDNVLFNGIVDGTTYYILTTLQGGATTDAVTTDLCISNNTAPVHPPFDTKDGAGTTVNDDNCVDAYSITADVVYKASTYMATVDADLAVPDCQLGISVWFVWEVPAGYPAGPVYFQVWNKNCVGGPDNPSLQVTMNPGGSCPTFAFSAPCLDVSSGQSTRNTNVGWDVNTTTKYYLNYTGNSDQVCDFNFMTGSVPFLKGIEVNSDTICAGETTTLTASGGTAYVWGGGETTESITVSPTVTTTYTVTATDGADGSAYATVTVAPAPTVTVNDGALCGGGAASATLIASGADTYAWTPATSLDVTTGAIVVSSPASTITYTVTGTALGCTGTAVSTVTIGSSLAITVNDATICSGQSATLTATGGDTYLWSDATTVNPLVISPTATTTYTVTGTTGGCSGDAVATVTVNGGLSVTVNDATICSGSSATLTAAGADTYLWSDATTVNPLVISPTATTTYTVTGTSSGCSGEAISTVIIGAADDASFSYTPSTVCQTGGADPTPVITGVAGGTFVCLDAALIIDVNTGVVTLAASAINTYTVTYTTSGACTNTSNFVLSIVNIPDATFSYAGPYCQSATNPSPTFLTGASAGTFSASAGGLVFANSATGEVDLLASTPSSYTITNTIAAGGGCAASEKTATIIITTGPATAVGNQTNCAGTSVTLTANGADSYSWSDGSVGSSLTVSPTSATSYTVTGTSAACSSSAVGTITSKSVPTVLVDDKSICFGESATITGSGADTYVWSNGAPGRTLSASPSLATTSYTITGTATSTGCSSDAVGTIYMNEIPTVTPNDATICLGESISLAADGADTYAWSTGDNTPTTLVSPSTTTQYTVTGTKGICTETALVTVEVTSAPSIAITAPTGICAGDVLTATASGADSYSWSDGTSGATFTASPTSATSYTVTGTSNVCSATEAFSIVVSIPPTVSVNSTTICSGENATLTATGGAAYSWTGGSSTTNILMVSPIATSTYTVTGDPGNCSDTAIAIVVVNLSPSVSIVQSGEICLGETDTITANGADTYVWSNGATGADLIASPTSTETYTVTGTAANGCTGIASNIISVNIPSDLIVSDDVILDIGTSTGIVASGGNTFLWTPTEGLDCADCAGPEASPLETTTYCVTAIDINNCIDRACLTVTVNIPCHTNDSLEVANAFSPNGDGHNDVMILHGWGACITEFKFAVFDRWGEKVFESNDPTDAWDGTYRGKQLDPAVFVYFIEARFEEGDVIVKNGTITLIR